MREGFQSQATASALVTALVVGLSAESALAQQMPPPPPPVNISSGSTQAQAQPELTAPPVITRGPQFVGQPRSVITDPSWARSPQPQYPATAMANGIGSGRVTLRCVVKKTGVVADCTILQETPPGQGFGESAISAAQSAQISPRSADGMAVGAMVQFSIRYEAP